MATLETIMQLKQQGFAEPQIIQTLQQQGISPNEINEALSQSKIKTELAPAQEASIPGAPIPGAIQPPTMPIGMPEPSPMSAGMPQTFAQPAPPAPAMQPSVMTAPEAPAPTPIPSEIPIQQTAHQTFPAQAPSPEMPYYEEYQPQQSSDIETINDIAEQIVDEKTNALQGQITDFTRFKDELTLEVEKINERLSRIENTFNQLQTAILGKIGEYGNDIQNISKEMHATQDSFSKIINPLTDNVRALQQIAGSASPQSESTEPKTHSKDDTTNFESYLR